MSEPIFRAWDNEKKWWINNFVIDKFGKVLVKECIILDATLCRSTGLKDKQGKMIFEGDIVKFDDFNPNHCEGDYLPRQTFEVSLYRTRFWLKEERFGHEGELLLSSENCKIIGNIFENP